MTEPVNVLMVDDIEQNLLALEALLSGSGLTLLKAQSGEQALSLLLDHEVALALLDVQMPRMDGFELAELMRGAERTRRIPIIFVTAASYDAQRTFRGYDAGAVDFLHKPVDPQILVSKVRVFVELHRQRLALARQAESLERALRLNELFTAVLGHDLRNPLAAVTNGAKLLARASSEPLVRDTATRILASGERMGRMIEQLLDMARLRSGRFELARTSCDLHELCRAVCDEFAEFDKAGGGGRLRLERAGDGRGRFDPDRLAQAFSNLVGNALQHGTPGEPVWVRVDGTRPEAVEVTVRNAGTVPAELLPRLFEPFHPGLPQARQRGDGLGLGLHIAERIVDAHGGRIEVRSQAPEGTVFTVRLPRA